MGSTEPWQGCQVLLETRREASSGCTGSVLRMTIGLRDLKGGGHPPAVRRRRSVCWFQKPGAYIVHPPVVRHWHSVCWFQRLEELIGNPMGLACDGNIGDRRQRPGCVLSVCRTSPLSPQHGDVGDPSVRANVILIPFHTHDIIPSV